MTTRIEIIQSVEYDIEFAKPVHVEFGVLDVRMVGFELRAGLELVGDFFRDLCRTDKLSARRKTEEPETG